MFISDKTKHFWLQQLIKSHADDNERQIVFGDNCGLQFLAFLLY